MRASSGISLEKQVGELYKAIFTEAVPLDAFPFDFLLLKPDHAHLQRILEAFSVQQLQDRASILRKVFKSCLGHIDPQILKSKRDWKKCENSIETLYVILFTLSTKDIQQSGTDVFQFICSKSEQEKFLQNLNISIKFLLTCEQTHVNLLNQTLKLFLVLTNCSDNIHSNIFLEYFQRSGIFDALWNLLERYENASKVQNICLKAHLGMIAVCHFRKYDAANIVVQKYKNFTKKDILMLDSHLQASLRFASSFFDSRRNSSHISLESVHSYFGDMIQRVSTLWNSNEQKAQDCTILSDFQSTITALPLLSFYNLLYNTPKTIIHISKLTKVSSVHGTLIQPKCNPKSLESMMSLSLLIFGSPVEKKYTESDSVLRLCLIIFRILSEDTASCVVLHDRSLHENGNPIICVMLQCILIFLSSVLDSYMDMLNLEVCLDVLGRLHFFGDQNHVASWGFKHIQMQYISITVYLLRFLKTLEQRLVSLDIKVLTIVNKLVGFILQVLRSRKSLFRSNSAKTQFIWNFANSTNVLRQVAETSSSLFVSSKGEQSSEKLLDKISAQSTLLAAFASKCFLAITTQSELQFSGQNPSDLRESQKHAIVLSIESELDQLTEDTGKTVPPLSKYVEDPKEKRFFNYMVSQVLAKYVDFLADAETIQSLKSIDS